MDIENDVSRIARPVRRTRDLVVRKVGDEVVAYDLDTERVTALDPVTVKIWDRLDGDTELTKIAVRSGLALAEVETRVGRLDEAGLIASGFDRRRFMRLSAAGAGVGVLLTIAVPDLASAASSRSLTITQLTTCVVEDKINASGVITKSTATIDGRLRGTGFAAGEPVTISFTIAFGGTPDIVDGSLSLTFTPMNSPFNRQFTLVATSTKNKLSYRDRSYCIHATNTDPNATPPTVTATGIGTMGTC